MKEIQDINSRIAVELNMAFLFGILTLIVSLIVLPIIRKRIKVTKMMVKKYFLLLETMEILGGAFLVTTFGFIGLWRGTNYASKKLEPYVQYYADNVLFAEVGVPLRFTVKTAEEKEVVVESPERAYDYANDYVYYSYDTNGSWSWAWVDKQGRVLEVIDVFNSDWSEKSFLFELTRADWYPEAEKDVQ